MKTKHIFAVLIVHLHETNLIVKLENFIFYGSGLYNFVAYIRLYF